MTEIQPDFAAIANNSQAVRSNLRANKWLTMLSPIESGAVQLDILPILQPLIIWWQASPGSVHLAV